MKVIILAAGRGSRLLPLTKDLPKCLLPLRPGVSVLEHQLAVLHECGIRDIIVVSGFKTRLIDEVITRFNTDSIKVENLFNPFFHVADNLLASTAYLTPAYPRDNAEAADLIAPLHDSHIRLDSVGLRRPRWLVQIKRITIKFRCH